jgi:ketosteroid isomerase-like protein
MTTERLRRLAADYAAAVDRRDADALRSLLTDDATLTVRDVVDGTEHVHEGPEAIAGIPAVVASRYPATFHLLGQGRYELLTGDRASGEVLCEAHHHIGALGESATDRVLHIRYRDAYRSTDDHGWQFESRTVEVQFVSEVPIPARGPRPGLDEEDRS